MSKKYILKDFHIQRAANGWILRINGKAHLGEVLGWVDRQYSYVFPSSGMMLEKITTFIEEHVEPDSKEG